MRVHLLAVAEPQPDGCRLAPDLLQFFSTDLPVNVTRITRGGVLEHVLLNGGTDRRPVAKRLLKTAKVDWGGIAEGFKFPNFARFF